MPTRLKDLHPLLAVASADLSQRLGRAPSVSELAAELAVSREDVVVALNAAWSCEPSPVDGCERAHHDDPRLSAAVAAFDKGLEKLGNRDAVREVLADLSEPGRVAVLLRLSGAMTQSQIAGYLGVSRIQVSGLLAESLRTMREHVR